MDHTMRTSELQKAIPKITQKMLIQQLRELQEDGIITRKAYPVIPPKVEYSLSKKGLILKPIVELMEEV
jgi:DNA-binding HxlR family transcriptional regulator